MADVDAALDTCHVLYPRNSVGDTEKMAKGSSSRAPKTGHDASVEHHCTCLEEPVSHFGISCRKADCALAPSEKGKQTS